MNARTTIARVLIARVLIARSASIAFAAMLSAAAAGAQLVRATGASPFVKDYTIDFAIPDAPATKLLSVDESAMLRPQTVRELTAAVSDFRGSNGAFVVPKRFGVEASPGLLIDNGTLTLNDYTAKKLLYATRFSGAAGRDSLNRGQVAAGVRFSLVDEQDIRSKGGGGNDTAVTRLTSAILDVYHAARLAVGPTAPLTLSDAQQIAVNALSDSIKSYWASKYWNARSLDIAFAGRASARDSLGNSPRVDQLAAWGTVATGLQGWGQLLLGLKLGSARDTAATFHASNSAAARLYVGSSTAKLFVEGQSALASKLDARWLVNGGFEARLPIVGWVDASAGYAANPSGGRPRLVSSFKVKSGLGL